MKHNQAIFLFSIYSYASECLHVLLAILPFPLRRLVFRCMFRELGHTSMIDARTYFRYPRKISLGHHVSINRGCNFYAVHQANGGTIAIGNHVALGPNVSIFAGGHDHTQPDLPVTAAPVVICDYVWVGGNSTILQGVTIGEGAIVAAGSVVTKHVAPYTIVAGNPARFIKPRLLKDGH